MAISIKPASTIEEEVYQRVIDNIPAGQFYLRAKYIQPRRDGDTIVPFIIAGTRGDPDGGGSRVMMDIYINEELNARIAMTAKVVTVNLRLLPPPDVNYIRIVEGVYDPSQGTFVPTGESAGTSVAVTNYASVHYGVGLDYFRKVWLPYLTQERSITSEWGSRIIEWYFKHHQRFPDTQALRTLAVRLASRATWTELPTNRGVADMVAALCASEPVIEEISNERATWDLALDPLLPRQTDYAGETFDVWFPDIPTAREVALLHLAGNVDYLNLKDHKEGHTFLEIADQDEPVIELLKDRSASNLAYLLRQIGPMDTWKAFVQCDNEVDVFQRFWDNALDNFVHEPGLGMGDLFDSGTTDGNHFPNPAHSKIFDSQDLDTSQEEPFTELWTGIGVNTSDGIEFWDSVVEVAKAEGQIPPKPPVSWEWEWTGGIEMSATSTSTVTNPLHGGAPPDFEE
jgi:hypothetical protein